MHKPHHILSLQIIKLNFKIPKETKKTIKQKQNESRGRGRISTGAEALRTPSELNVRTYEPSLGATYNSN